MLYVSFHILFISFMKLLIKQNKITLTTLKETKRGPYLFFREKPPKGK